MTKIYVNNCLCACAAMNQTAQKHNGGVTDLQLFEYLQNILHDLMTNNLFHIRLNFKTHFA